MQSSLEKLLVEGPKVTRELQELRVTKRSEDGNIEVTVNAQGQLEALKLDARIYRKPNSKELADAILSLTKDATTEAREKSVVIAERIAPRESIERNMAGDIWGGYERIQDTLREV